MGNLFFHIDDNILIWVKNIILTFTSRCLSHVSSSFPDVSGPTNRAAVIMPLSRRASCDDCGPRLLQDVWVLTVLAILIVILRVTAKWKIGKFGLDDALMTFALVSNFLFLFFPSLFPAQYIAIWIWYMSMV